MINEAGKAVIAFHLQLFKLLRDRELADQVGKGQLDVSAGEVWGLPSCSLRDFPDLFLRSRSFPWKVSWLLLVCLVLFGEMASSLFRR